jgi:predicted porin
MGVVHFFGVHVVKKTLICLAVLTVAGGAIAQVSLTGRVAFGFVATTVGNAAATKSSGLGFDKSELNILVKEDLGNGQFIEARLGLAGLDRSGESSRQPFYSGSNGPVTGRDASITYTNMSFGQVKLSTTESADYFSGVANLNAPVIDMDGKLHETKSSSDNISYTVPVGPVYVTYDHGEPSSGLGAGKGSESNTGMRTSTLVAYYGGGPLTLLGAYRKYDNGRSGPCTYFDCPAIYGTKDWAINLQGAYDIGVAKLGLGYQYAELHNGIRQVDAKVSVVAPLGPITLGVAVANSRTADAPDTSAFFGGRFLASPYQGSSNAYSVGASYALSKRTSILARYAAWVHSGYSQYEADVVLLGAALASGKSGNGAGGLGWGNVANESSILMVHTF